MNAINSVDDWTEIWERVYDGTGMYALVEEPSGRPWLVYESESGDMWAVSMPYEEDIKNAEEPAIAPIVDAETLTYPLTLIAPEMPEPDERPAVAHLALPTAFEAAQEARRTRHTLRHGNVCDCPSDDTLEAILLATLERLDEWTVTP